MHKQMLKELSAELDYLKKLDPSAYRKIEEELGRVVSDSREKTYMAGIGTEKALPKKLFRTIQATQRKEEKVL